jgi:plastocyanin
MTGKLKTVLFSAAVVITVMSRLSMAQKVYTVGDAMGWLIPPNGASTYTIWAAKKSFTVDDILVFNFASGKHDVAEVTKANFNGCNPASPISKTSKSPANITVKSAGEHYYICTFNGHCSGGGQKLAINVSAASSTPAPQPSASSPAPVLAPVSPSMAPGPELAPAPGPDSVPTGPRLPMTYTVGDALGWNVPSNGSNVGYQNWASDKDFMVGDTLVFNYVNRTHNVAEVTKQGYNSCNTSSPISLNTNPPTRITLNTTGVHYFTCTFPRHCNLGQQLAINVHSTAASLPLSPAGDMSPSPTATPPSASSAGSSEIPSSPAGSSEIPSSPAGSPPPLNSATFLGSVESLCVTILVSIVVALVM